MTLKYESELIKEIVDTRGHETPLLHYESECVESWISESEGAYPKLTDYEAEWLNYIVENPIGKFPYVTLSDVTEATVENVVPYAYKSAILKGSTKYRDIDTGEFLETFEEGRNLELVPVKMPVLTTTGKNLFKHKKDNYEVNGIIVNPTADGFELNGTCTDYQSWDLLTGKWFGGHNPAFKTYYSNKILANCSGEYTFSFKIGRENALELGQGIILSLVIVYDDTNKEEYSWDSRSGDFINVRKNITVKSHINGVFATRWYGGNCDEIQVKNVQIEQGTQTTSHEPHKSNILTVNEEVELRGIGEVQDTLDCLTGELVQRTGKFMVDGTEDFRWYGDLEETLYGFNIYKSSIVEKLNNEVDADRPSLCSTLEYRGTTMYGKPGTGFAISGGSDSAFLQIVIQKEKLSDTTLDGIKQYLSENPLYFVVPLLDKSIKTVDLTVTDQDGNAESIIRPIEGTMHLMTEGDTIKPLFSGEVPVEAITQNLVSFIEG